MVLLCQKDLTGAFLGCHRWGVPRLLENGGITSSALVEENVPQNLEGPLLILCCAQQRFL